VVNDAITEGFIPVLLNLKLDHNSPLIVMTDHKEAHIDALIATHLGLKQAFLNAMYLTRYRLLIP